MGRINLNKQTEKIKQAWKISSQILQHLSSTSDNLEFNLDEKGQKALDIIAQRHQPDFEQFYIVQIDKYEFQSVFPSKLSEWSQLHPSLLDAYHYIHEKIGRVKIIIRMLEN